MADHCFISYSNADALEFATRLADELQGQHPFFKIWFDKRELSPSSPDDWDDQIADAIKACKCLIFIMTVDSTADLSVCKDEWTWALKYKKPVITVRRDRDIEVPFRLSNRQHVDFVKSFDIGMAQLRSAIARLDSPEGMLDELKLRLAAANRDLRRARPEDQPRIQADIDHLNKQIEVQQNIVDHPEAARTQTQKNIEAGLERERQPEKPAAKKAATKFINPPPGIAPNYFQDRIVETRQIFDFLNNESQRMMTIVGRGGVGKTAMVCRFLKGLETGELPNDLGAMEVDGIVYLSESGGHRVNFTNIFYDLCKLLPVEKAQELDAIYKNQQGSTESKMRALLDQFGSGRVVLLLDNLEPLTDPETFAIRDEELDQALRTFINGSHTTVKILLTTRLAPRALNLLHPGRQRVLALDEGLESPYAENILREMDSDGTLGLKDAPDALLSRARERTRGYPRALEALFAILASDRYTTLEELLAMPTPDNVVEALVGEAFNRLDMESQKVMQALAVYSRPVPPAAVDYLLAPQLPTMDSAPILQRLANMHFARKESGRFYLHPVDRELTFKLIPGEGMVPGNAGNEFTQKALLTRAADYFAKARKPSEEWKNLEDLSAQLAEFDLRCAAGDYDTAANVLDSIDDLMSQWGHYRLTVHLSESILGQLQDEKLILPLLHQVGWTYIGLGETQKTIDLSQQGLLIARDIKDRHYEMGFLNNIAAASMNLGDILRAVESFKQALEISRQVGNQVAEGAMVSNLGSTQKILGNTREALEAFEQGLVLHRRYGNRVNESITLDNIASCYIDLGEYQNADGYCRDSIQIADEISYSVMQQMAREHLAESYLHQNNLAGARAAIEKALHYDVPVENHYVNLLYGIITLRQGDHGAARQAFMRALFQADEIIKVTPEYYDAIYTAGQASCGLAVLSGSDEKSAHTLRAVKDFRSARKIASHAGVIKRVLQLFDELAKCDEERILKDVRQVVEGK